MDAFDELLIHSCSILSNDTDTEDAYGQESRLPQAWDVVASSVPCRVDVNAIGRPEERKTDLKVAIHYRRIYMRDQTLLRGQSLNPLNAVLVNGVYYNVIDVLPQYDATALHHLEVLCEEIYTPVVIEIPQAFDPDAFDPLAFSAT